jgi:hypothetical protein
MADDRWERLPASENVQDRRGEYPAADFLSALWQMLLQPQTSPDMVLGHEWQQKFGANADPGYVPKPNPLASSAGFDSLFAAADQARQRELNTLPHYDTVDHSDPNAPPVGWQRLLGR